MEEQETISLTEKSWRVLQRRWIPGLSVFFPVFLISLGVASMKRPVYQAEGKLQFQRVNNISTLTGVAPEIAKLEPVVQDNRTNPLNTEAEVIRSHPIIDKTIKRLGLKKSDGVPLKSSEFLEQLTIKDVRGTDVLQISYNDTNPKVAAEVVNTLMNAYLEHNVAYHRSTVTAARKFLENQLPSAERVVRQAEAELRKFQEKNRIFSLDEEASKSIETLADLERRINETRSQVSETSAQLKGIREKLGMNARQAIAVTSLSQSEGVQSVVKELQGIESQLADKRNVFTETHPEIVKLREKRDSLQQILQNRIAQVSGAEPGVTPRDLQVGQLKQQLSAEMVQLESRRLGLASQLATLTATEKEYRQRLNSLPLLRQQLRELERKVQAAQSTYSLLLQKLQESRIAENQNLGNAQIISQATVPDQPLGSKSVNYLSAGLLGLLSSMAAMYLLETRDKLIKTVDEARESMGLTLLGVIPSPEKSKFSLARSSSNEYFIPSIVVRDLPRSATSEAYRMLRANLNFISADKKLKSIVVTSSVPKEGKSTVAANLAMAIAQMERKVLLVDADLHRPVQHQIWDINNTKGLSNVIVGQSEVMSAIKSVADNLDVLTAGVVPPSPGALLDSKRMASLIESFSSYYDFVIVDAPSLNVAADAATLGQMSDGLLLVVRPGVADRVSAAFALELLEKSGQNVLGQVVNAVQPGNEPYSYYQFNDSYYAEETGSIPVVQGMEI